MVAGPSVTTTTMGLLLLSVALVARTGALALAVLVVVVVVVGVVAGQTGEPQALSVGHQPPPRLAGQVRNPARDVVDIIAGDDVGVEEVEGVTVKTWVTVVGARLEEGVMMRVVVTV